LVTASLDQIAKLKLQSFSYCVSRKEIEVEGGDSRAAAAAAAAIPFYSF